jgi:hypothetical protein
VEDAYFVQDGHHHISVARAGGHVSIDTEAVVWQVAGPLSWEDMARGWQHPVILHEGQDMGSRF